MYVFCDIVPIHLYSTSYDGCHLVYCYNVCHLVGPVPAVTAPRGLASVAAGLVSRVLVLPHAQPAGGLARGPGQVIFIQLYAVLPIFFPFGP